MLNQTVLTGNLGADPEVFYSSEGHPVATFNLAFRVAKKKTGWIKVVCFGKLAELAEKHLHRPPSFWLERCEGRPEVWAEIPLQVVEKGLRKPRRSRGGPIRRDAPFDSNCSQEGCNSRGNQERNLSYHE